MPKLSIITINYNNSIGLQKTIESVAIQHFQEYEFIVIDGNSTDGSIEIIKNNHDKITYWRAESDNGIYDAMNKGIQQAKGEFLLFLNSGDYLTNEKVLQEVAAQQLVKGINYGDVIWEEIGQLRQHNFPDKLKFSFFLEDALPHQSTFFHRNVFDEIGLYPENYGIIGDWAFTIKAICKYNISYQHLPISVSVCNRDGLSCKPENWQRIIDNKKKLLSKEFPIFYEEFKDLKEKEDLLNSILNSKAFKASEAIKKLLRKNRRVD